MIMDDKWWGELWDSSEGKALMDAALGYVQKYPSDSIQFLFVHNSKAVTHETVKTPVPEHIIKAFEGEDFERT